MAEELEKKCAEYLAGWKRALADYDNLKKDLAKEKSAIGEAVRESIALQLIPILDSFDQINHHRPELKLEAEDQKKFSGWCEGVGHVRGQLARIVKDMGLEEVKVDGAFNPEEHEAVGERDDGQENGVILEATQKGWRLGGKVIRPAKVIIQSTA